VLNGALKRSEKFLYFFNCLLNEVRFTCIECARHILLKHFKSVENLEEKFLKRVDILLLVTKIELLK